MGLGGNLRAAALQLEQVTFFGASCVKETIRPRSETALSQVP
jgi:hypothetical protein